MQQFPIECFIKNVSHFQPHDNLIKMTGTPSTIQFSGEFQIFFVFKFQTSQEHHLYNSSWICSRTLSTFHWTIFFFLTITHNIVVVLFYIIQIEYNVAIITAHWIIMRWHVFCVVPRYRDKLRSLRGRHEQKYYKLELEPRNDYVKL